MMKILGKVFFQLLLCLVSAAFIFPLIVTLTGSFLDQREALSYLEPQFTRGKWLELKLVPDVATVRQYYILLVEQYKYLHMFGNSVKYSVITVLGQLLIGSTAGYAFSKLKFKGREAIFFIYIIAMMMPFQVTMVPNHMMLRAFHILNTDLAIILPAIFAPFGVFLLRQYMKGIPDECIEASIVDGATRTGAFFHIILPLSVPGLTALGVLGFIDCWNMVEQPLIFLEDSLKYPLSLSLNVMLSDAREVAFAGSFLYMIPMLLLFFYFQEHILSGIKTGRLSH